MANNENGNGLLGIFQNAVDSVKSTVEGIKLPEINIPNLFQPNPAPKDEPDPSEEIKAISSRNAVKTIYFMMAADGKIFEEEEAKFNEIGRELDPGFETEKTDIIQECQDQMRKVTVLHDYYAVLEDGVDAAISANVTDKDLAIAPKVLVWDLLTLAYSDNQQDEQERKLLNHIVSKFNIDPAILLEMESSLLTLMDLENEAKWIKTTDRPYLTIEAMVNEISDRKAAVLEGLKALIAF